MTVHLREMIIDDVVAGFALSRASGWNQREDDWRLLLTMNPGQFLAAVSDGRVIGTGGAACYGTALAWVCMILVDPAERGRGVGTRLVQGVLDRLAGMAVVGLDATPGGRPVYARIGFAGGRTLLRMGASAPETPGSRPPGARRLSSGDLDAVLRLDRDVFGADRGDVLRWAFAQKPEVAWCVPEEGPITGYCFGRHGQHSEHVGPLVAAGLDAALALVRAALTGAAGRVVLLDVPAERTDWLALLTELGFHEQRPLTRMYRGGALPPGRPDLQLAILGPEFG